MARLREFDTEEVLDQAMDAFWRHGYEATSVRDLLEATGLQKGSLYQAFGDKHSLFMTILERYIARAESIAGEVFDNTPPGEAIAAWMQRMHAESSAQGCEKGCLIWNTTSELAPHDEAVRTVLAEHMTRMGKLFTNVIRRGQAEGAYRTDVRAESLTTFLMAAGAGMVALNKGDFTSAYPEDLPRLVLATLTG